jgi:hypothetical protein
MINLMFATKVPKFLENFVKKMMFMMHGCMNAQTHKQGSHTNRVQRFDVASMRPWV